ncbi:MAG: 2Fe-2S iron-sulfur cluster binding domain-containing protein [Synechococcales cyanobacterium]
MMDGGYNPEDSPQRYRVQVWDRQRQQHLTFVVSSQDYILDAAEDQGIELPSACRNGACTTCAVRVKSGSLDQREAMGICRPLQQQGYALICVGKATSDLLLETQDEDEVYELQFGRFFGRGRTRRGLVMDED